MIFNSFRKSLIVFKIVLNFALKIGIMIDVSKIISVEEVKNIYKGFLLNEILESDIEVGFIDWISIDKAFIQVMNLWVNRIDFYLSKLTLYSPQYIALFAQRGITFEEFSYLFINDIEENEYRFYKVFEFLQIQTNRQRLFYLSKFTNDIESYKTLIAGSKIALTDFFFEKLNAYIPFENLQRHTYVNGMSGAGKSELLKLIFYNLQQKSQAKRNYALVLIDIHGDLANEIKAFKLNLDLDRLIVIEPHPETDHYPIINPFYLFDRSEKSIEDTTEDFLRVFDDLINDKGLSGTMANLMRPMINTLLRKKNASFIDLLDFLNDEKNSHLVELGKRNPNPILAKFFKDESQKDSIFRLSKQSLRTKIGTLLQQTMFYRMTTGDSTINIEKELNEGKIIIFNLSKDKMKQTPAQTFARFIIAMIFNSAEKRLSMDKRFRKPIFLFLDEAQNFTGESMNVIFREARKAGLHLILANHSLAHFPSDMATTVLGNTDVKIIGRNGDVENSLKPLGKSTQIKIDDLLSLEKYHFYIKAGDRTPYKFATPSVLIKPSRYILSDKDTQKIDEYMLKTSYYKSLTKEKIEEEEPHEEVKQTRIEKPEKDQETEAPKPMFDL